MWPSGYDTCPVTNLKSLKLLFLWLPERQPILIEGLVDPVQCNGDGKHVMWYALWNSGVTAP